MPHPFAVLIEMPRAGAYTRHKQNPLGDDLPAAGNIEPGEMAQQSRHCSILPF